MSGATGCVLGSGRWPCLCVGPSSHRATVSLRMSLSGMCGCVLGHVFE